MRWVGRCKVGPVRLGMKVLAREKDGRESEGVDWNEDGNEEVDEEV